MIVEFIPNVDITRLIDSDVDRAVELPITVAKLPEFQNGIPHRIESLYAMVVGIGNVDIVL